jgi:hypothetical protein
MTVLRLYAATALCVVIARSLDYIEQGRSIKKTIHQC